MSFALLPGSYDPITLGHLDIIRRAASLYEHVVVAVMNNADKTYLFSPEERTEMVRLSIRNLPNARAVFSDGYTVDLFDAVGADVIVKGIRNEKDQTYEKQIESYNLAHNPRAVTQYLTADDAFRDISSTEVRKLLLAGKSPDGLVPPAVLDYLQRYLQRSGEKNDKTFP